MVHVLSFYVDGGCRNNGYSNAIGAACAVLERRRGPNWSRTLQLPRRPKTPTNQRAEIQAIILALQWALEKCQELDGYRCSVVKIHSDSRYALGCMNTWIDRWAANDWLTSSGNPVANLDLILKAAHLDDELTELGRVDYIWVPRSQTLDADERCNEALDAQENWYHR